MAMKLSGVLLGVAMVGGAGIAQAEAVVILYAAEDLDGERHEISAGDAVGADLREIDFNDGTESIQVMSGEWEFYRNINYGDAYEDPNGNPIVLGPARYNRLPDGISKDDISSVRCVRSCFE